MEKNNETTISGKIDLFLEALGGLEKGRWGSKAVGNRLLGAGVLGDSLGSLRDGVLGQLSGQDQTDGGLNFPAGDGGTLVVVGKTGSFTGNTLEDIVDEGVHDSHSFARDTSWLPRPPVRAPQPLVA